ncbi:hypothetical protein PTKIN_Ptkin05aG0058400 [Pterospermum kingtungense]
MASQVHLDKMQLRQNYRNLWHTDLMSTMQHDTPYCCFAFWCGPCASYMLRKRALYNDMSRYTCCAGYMPCSGRCGERKCPEFCLFTEVFCCFGNSVASTRFLLQDEFNIQTTKCDNCIIGFMFCLQQIACIFSIIAMIVGSSEIQDAAQLLNCLADMVYCTRNIRLKWTNEMASSVHNQWQCPLFSRCRALINQFLQQSAIHQQHMDSLIQLKVIHQLVILGDLSLG